MYLLKKCREVVVTFFYLKSNGYRCFLARLWRASCVCFLSPLFSRCGRCSRSVRARKKAATTKRSISNDRQKLEK